jgi:hypothetical protein
MPGKLNSEDKTVGAARKGGEECSKRLGSEKLAMGIWAGVSRFLFHLSPKYSSVTHNAKIKPKK